MRRNRDKKNKKSLIEKILEKEKEARAKNSNKHIKVLEKSTMNKRLIYVMVFFIAIFLSIVFYLVYFQLFKAESVAQNDYNKRLWVDENEITRGNIYDRDGQLLVYSDKDQNGSSYRVYNFGEVDSTFTGYSSTTYGKSGLEKSYNNQLLNLSTQPMSKFRDMVENSGQGNNLNLTINQQIQSLAYQYLGDNVGAIAVMKPSTGEVLAMVSKPGFNPNSIEDEWSSLIQNTNAPLLNRVTQGVYRPGSTFKIVTTTAILENNIDQSYTDTGTETIQGYDIKNYGDYTYGALDLRSAFINSVNTYFASKTNELGEDALKAVTEKYMFNKKYSFDLDITTPEIPYDDLNQVDLAMTGFGYGKTQVNPLHMAMIASAIANDGKMMQPYLVSSVVDKDGEVVEETEASVLSEVTSQENAQLIRDYMVGVVNEGTAKSAFLQGVQVAGKTGTTEKDNGSTDAWFVGFAPAYDPQIAISIVLEDNGGTGGDAAAPIAGNLINAIISNVNLN